MTSALAAGSGLLRRPVPLTTPLRYVPFSIDVWCPVAPSHTLQPGSLKAISLVGRRIVLFRGADGRVGAIEDRCPHRGVALSLGSVTGNHLQCAYHGWLVDDCGRARAAPNIGRLDDGISARAYAVREHVGLIWVFLGDREHADLIPLPVVAPYGARGSVDLMLVVDVPAHWSLLLDNGIDLFHGHLHRDLPYFFAIEAIEEFGSDGETFVVRYRATIRGPFGTRRKGVITVRTQGTGVTLDFSGFPIVHGLVTPAASDGRRLITWYLMTFPLPLSQRLVVRALMPAIRACLLRGFRQDTAVLASEQAAFEEGTGVQYEVNPVVPAAHRHIEDAIARRAWRLLSNGARPDRIDRGDLMRRAARGELAIFARRNGKPSLLSPAELASVRPGAPLLDVMRYDHCYFLDQT